MHILVASLALAHFALRMCVRLASPAVISTWIRNWSTQLNQTLNNLQWTRNAFVPLLVTRIANGKTSVPSGGRTRTGCTRATVSTNATILAFPSHFGNVGEKWASTSWMVALVTSVTDQHFADGCRDVTSGGRRRHRCRCSTSDANFAVRTVGWGQNKSDLI